MGQVQMKLTQEPSSPQTMPSAWNPPAGLSAPATKWPACAHLRGMD